MKKREAARARKNDAARKRGAIFADRLVQWERRLQIFLHVPRGLPRSSQLSVFLCAA
ncbi:hypothetical protein [Burkholderia aenigmatica]|uniref:hypothetical protein n=1 Tax=Burkholderia aenigmatica TaxID=2015348 RepID=UPI0015842F9D|nr:hypothetical protein [Burkholderia aenigmatica]